MCKKSWPKLYSEFNIFNYKNWVKLSKLSILRKNLPIEGTEIRVDEQSYLEKQRLASENQVKP